MIHAIPADHLARRQDLPCGVRMRVGMLRDVREGMRRQVAIVEMAVEQEVIQRTERFQIEVPTEDVRHGGIAQVLQRPMDCMQLRYVQPAGDARA